MYLFFLPFLFVAIMTAQVTEPPESEVTLRVVNVEGVTQAYRVTSFKNDRGVEFADRFDGLRGRVPRSITPYSFQLSWTLAQNERVADFTRLSGTIAVTDPETWRTVSTSPSVRVLPDGSGAGSLNWSAPPGYVWRGRINPLPREPLWVQLRSAVRTGYLTSAEIESAVDEHGEFRVYGPWFPNAAYVLYLINHEGTIVHVELVKPAGRYPLTSLELTLPASPPTVQPID